MRWRTSLSSALGVGALILSGCTPAALTARLEATEAKLEASRLELQELRREVNDGLPMALCSPELAELLEDVQRECAPSKVDSGDDAACTTRQIKPSVIAIDPEHKGRLLKLMADVRHQVFYFREGAFDIVPLRRERLKKFARMTRLHNTQFIVVSSPETGEKEALRRAAVIVRELVEDGVPRHLIQRWIYQYPVDKRDIVRANDQPSIGEEQKLNRGVWVFRADC